MNGVNSNNYRILKKIIIIKMKTIDEYLEEQINEQLCQAYPKR